MAAAQKKPKPTRLSVEDVVFIQQRRPRLRKSDDKQQVFTVPSLDSEAVYNVSLRLSDGALHCSCPAFRYNPTVQCKHLLQCKLFLGVAPRREIVMEPWKGKDNVTFEYRANDATWVIVTHQKDKDTMEVEERTYEVPHRSVTVLYDILKELGADKAPVPAQVIWNALILAYQLNLTVNEFNGGSNRGKVYFPLAYYPLKVLEHLGYINFGSKTTELLKVQASVSTEAPS